MSGSYFCWRPCTKSVYQESPGFNDQTSFLSLDPDLLLITLHPMHLPGSDLMSKLILRNQAIIDIIVTTLIGKYILLSGIRWKEYLFT